MVAGICLMLALSVGAVYYPVTHHRFINCDDPEYITSNRLVQAGLTWSGIRWAFTTSHAENWHPVTWLSHMLDCEIFGMRPGWHHLESVFLHAGSTVLLFLAL